MAACRALGVDPEQGMREATKAIKRGLQKKWVVEAQANATS